MKKFFLTIFLLLDLAVIGGAAVFLYTYVNSKRFAGAVPLSKPAAVPIVARIPAPAPTVPGAGAAPAKPAAPSSVSTPASPYRNIGFSYRNSKAKQVLIRADFTGWKGVAMKRDASGVWTYTVQLTPGEYAYCFTVDDKIIRDPDNKRTKLIAQTKVSAIEVKLATDKPSPAP